MDNKKLGRLALLILPTVAIIAMLIFLPQLRTVMQKAEIASVQLNMPLKKMEINEEKTSSNTGEKDENDTKTTSVEQTTSQETEEAVEASKRFTKKELTQTPNDIIALQEAKREAIKSEQKVADISEKPYVGGGTIISHGNMKVQSNIPNTFYALNIEDLLSKKADLSIETKEKPTVLIYHSHTTEAYQTLDVGYYTTVFNERNDDIGQNMVRVGDEITSQLEKAGFKVIHDKTIYDKNYSDAYNLSDVSIKKYLEENPDIDVTIDVHRDSINFKDGTKVKPVANIMDKKAAQVMIIPGCEYGEIKNFPDWEYNLRFALQLQQKAEEMYAGLMRPVLFSARRYNLFETHNSILLEIGSDGNTLEEAVYSGKLIGTALAAVLEDYVVKK